MPQENNNSVVVIDLKELTGGSFTEEESPRNLFMKPMHPSPPLLD